MNERIKNLAVQSGLSWCIQTPFDQTNLQEFAELIVQECIKEINSLKNTTTDEMISKGYGCWDSYSGAVDDSIGRLEEHFGIE